MRKLLLALTLLTCGISAAQTDTDGTVRSLIPSTISIRRPDTVKNLVFDINPGNFPPRAYPARYLAQPQEFSIFSSATKPWTVQVELRPQPDLQGRTMPARLLSFRVNDGPWIRATGLPQVIMSNVGPTPGWLPLKLEVALDLEGGEAGGDYAFDVAFTAVVLP